jgi:short subunit dehydrogenase-like uncharacterized protein
MDSSPPLAQAFRLGSFSPHLQLAYSQTIKRVGLFSDVATISPVLSLAGEALDHSLVLTNNRINVRRARRWFLKVLRLYAFAQSRTTQ